VALWAHTLPSWPIMAAAVRWLPSISHIRWSSTYVCHDIFAQKSLPLISSFRCFLSNFSRILGFCFEILLFIEEVFIALSKQERDYYSGPQNEGYDWWWFCLSNWSNLHRIFQHDSMTVVHILLLNCVFFLKKKFTRENDTCVRILF